MGNCIRKESSTQWGGEDWGSFASNDHKTRNHGNSYHENSTDDNFVEAKSSFIGERVLSSAALPTAGTEMKIKISKKQLEQLLKKAEADQGISAEQVLAQLMNAGERLDAHQRPWRPALQSISE